MKNPASVDSLQEHPAQRCWNSLGSRTSPDSIEIVQDEATRSVYRLVFADGIEIEASPRQYAGGVARVATAVIAKRALRADIEKEAYFYRDALPALSMSVIPFLGVVDDDDPRYAWLLIGDAGGEHYLPSNRVHRKLAADWLGRFHVASAGKSLSQDIEDRGPAHYFPYLGEAQKLLENHRLYFGIDPEDCRVLDEIRAFCEKLSSRRSELTRFCGDMPHTLVHGDVKPDNMLVSASATGSSLAVIDWHEGGRGVPALDIAKFLGYRVRLDFDTYLNYWLETWPQWGVGTVRRLGYVGEIFRWIASVRWQLEDFQYGRIERGISSMRVYRDWSTDIDRAAPWWENPDLAEPDWRPMEKYWT